MADRLLGILTLAPFIVFAFWAFRQNERTRPTDQKAQDFSEPGNTAPPGDQGGSGHH